MGRLTLWATALAVSGALVACRPSDVLSVPAPAGVLSSGGLQSQIGAEGAFNGAKGQLFLAMAGPAQDDGLLMWSGMLTDEFTYSDFSNGSTDATVDARLTAAHGVYGEYGDSPWEGLLTARENIVLAIPLLVANEPASGRSKIGEAYALTGYAEILLAESYCAGTALNQVTSGGGIQYGMPLTTDSLLGTAATHFDSAIANANGNDTVADLASVGLGRALLNRGQYAAAAAAVQNVATGFVYNVELEPGGYAAGAPYTFDLYDAGFYNGLRVFNVSDQEGGNGLNFISAHDPRLMFDTTLQTFDRTSVWYLPLKFEADFGNIPLATGLEAQLMLAEAELASGQPGPWLTDLNSLRNSGCVVSGADTTCAVGTGQVPSQMTGLPSLVDPGTDSGRVSLMFRERAFWLFGTGTRLGDLRRLIRQYGRDQSTVFPTGVYANGHNPDLPAPIPNYGADVDFTLPTPASGLTITNPNYKGCLTPTTTA